MNISLKTFYFGGEVPSLFTCLFHATPLSIFSQTELANTPTVTALTNDILEKQLQQQVDALPDLAVPIAVERLLIVDKYVRAGSCDARECKEIAMYLFKTCFEITDSEVCTDRCG